jgi:hypothetical protein
MRVFNICRFLAGCAVLALAAGYAGAQTRVDLRTQSKSADFSAASSTKPFQTGTALPATCSLGQTFFQTNATAGSNFYACTSANTWTLESGTPSLLVGNLTAGPAANIDFSAAASVSLPAPWLASTASNAYTPGAKQIFQSSATTAGRSDAGVTDPSVLTGGDQWMSLAGNPRWYDGAAVREAVSINGVQTLTGKTWNGAAIGMTYGGLGANFQTIAKGGMLSGSGSGALALTPAGPDGQVWTADSASIGGAKWAAAGGTPAHYNTSTVFTGIGPTAFTPSAGTLQVFDNTSTTGSTNLLVTRGAGQGSNDLITVYDSGGVAKLFQVTGDNTIKTSASIYVGNSSGNAPILINAASKSVQVSNDGIFSFASGAYPTGSGPDAGLGRNAAGIVEVNNGTAGTYRDVKARLYTSNGYAQASLPTAPNGSIVYCTDCNSVCSAAGGSGTMCKRIGGVWVVF